MKINYIAPRFIRHILPDSIAKFLLEKRFIIKPGQESTDPANAVKNYQESLSQFSESFVGKRVLVFGYGGRFAVGCALIENGAKQVILVDRFSPPDTARNQLLMTRYANLLCESGGEIQPSGEELIMINGDICEEKIQDQIGEIDIILSNSVFEHIPDIDTIMQALSTLQSEKGFQFHKIDLRDHFFRYPFEMLTFSEKVWCRWLNPSSHHNRCRYGDYVNVFKKYYNTVAVEIDESLKTAFMEAKPRIRSEFLSGDDDVDSISQITVFLKNKK